MPESRHSFHGVKKTLSLELDSHTACPGPKHLPQMVSLGRLNEAERKDGLVPFRLPVPP